MYECYSLCAPTRICTFLLSLTAVLPLIIYRVLFKVTRLPVWYLVNGNVAKGGRSGPPTYVAWRAGTTTLWHSKL
jgi:hypothetical protein